MISDELKQKKQLIKLRKLFFDMHFECSEYASKNALKVKKIKGVSNRSTTKILYFLERGDWSEAFKLRLNNLQKRITRLGYVGIKKPRDFWLPTIIEHANIITFVIYQAKSVRNISTPQARTFAEKYGYEKPNPKASFSAIYSNGRACHIRVEYNNKVDYYKFPEIAICLCDNKKLPKIKKRRDETLDLLPSEPILRINSDSPLANVFFSE